MSVDKFYIGAASWPGLSKVVEEGGELLQVAGKLIGSGGSTAHWSGDLRPMLVEEIADVWAALDFFVMRNLEDFECVAISRRRQSKFHQFMKWDRETKERGSAK